MNKNLQTLARKVKYWNINGEYQGPYEKCLEEFAELIVKECVNIVDTWSNEEPCAEGYDKFSVSKLKEHFGIQE